MAGTIYELAYVLLKLPTMGNQEITNKSNGIV